MKTRAGVIHWCTRTIALLTKPMLMPSHFDDYLFIMVARIEALKVPSLNP
jgi:hypothetical protein